MPDIVLPYSAGVIDMKKLRLFCQGLVWLAAAGTCLPTSFAVEIHDKAATVAAKPESPSKAVIRDVALRPDGLLIGRVFSEAMRPEQGVEVTIRIDGQTTAATATDANGVFAVAGLRGGIHQVVTEGSVENCRLWAPGTAPPRALSEVRFVRGQDKVIRGQRGYRSGSFMDRTQEWLSDPWVVAGIVATAVAVPVILHNTDDDEGS
jgi:hypothetical protein